MKRQILRAGAAALLTGVTVFTAGCRTAAPQEGSVGAVSKTGDRAVDYNNFALRLLRGSRESGESSLVSPLSIAMALGMLAEGAEAETLVELESALNMSAASLGSFLEDYPADGEKLKSANAAWLNNDDALRFEPKQDYLKTISDGYGATLYADGFTDKTRLDINAWVGEHTDGQIPNLLEQLDPNAVMVLVNAVAFDAKWEKPYEPGETGQDVFTNADGSKSKVDFLYGEEATYYEDDTIKGFCKYYEGRDYAFAAMVPRDGVTLDSYLESLDGKTLAAYFAADSKALQKAERVSTAIPKLELAHGGDLYTTLQKLGVRRAFSPDEAQFGGMGTADGNIYIGQAVHKTTLSLTEEGTRAAAATAISMDAGSAYEPPKHKVYLNRPFAFFIIDTRTQTPIFIGTVERI